MVPAPSAWRKDTHYMSEFEEHVSEVMAFQQQQADLAKQHDEIAKAQIESFIDSLNADQLKTLGKMIVISVNDTDAGWQFAGLVSGALIWKHGRGWAGEESPLADPATSLAFKMEQAGGEPMNDMERINKDAEDERARLMKLYNVVPDPSTEGYFKCGGCGVFIMSLEDRMLREPGVKGCTGCQEQAKFG